jgi:hypothetical protein
VVVYTLSLRKALSTESSLVNGLFSCRYFLDFQNQFGFEKLDVRRFDNSGVDSV